MTRSSRLQKIEQKGNSKMIELIFALICSASMAIALRLSGRLNGSRYGLLVGNYLTCVLMAWLSLPEKAVIPANGAMWTAMAAGVFNGFIFLADLLLFQLNIRKNGAVLATTFSKLGILIPVGASILFLGERPTVLQAAGMVLVLVAILLIHLEKGEARASFKTGLLLLLLFYGIGDGMAKVFEYIGERQYDALFLFYTFITALILSSALFAAELRREKKRWRPAELISGITVGVPNYLSSLLLLKAVTKLPAYVVYPCYSVGAVLVVCLVSILFLKDRMTKHQALGCGVILAALVLLNI